jgi:DNA-binding response OmpR family regulator
MFSATQFANGDTMLRNTQPLVLIVDDERDIRRVLRFCLEEEYRVIEAEDGEIGIRKAIQTAPDLVISDIRMPVIDGFAVCQTLKQDEKTSHIPIILMTAHDDQPIKTTSFKTGADQFLSKPFDTQELLARVESLIHQRRRLRERFRVGDVLKPGDIIVTSVDDQFLRKMKSIVEERMHDETFSVEELAQRVGMSRSQMHRKMRSLTNLMPSGFIRYLRLHRARDLLVGKGGTVSEVAYQVGFGSVSHFTRCFRKQFGTVPSAVGDHR